MKTLVAICALAAALVYFAFGTLSPCGMLREKVRRSDSFAAVLPDAIIDAVLVAQYGALSPGRCLNLLTTNESRTAPQSKQQAAIKSPINQTRTVESALEEIKLAISECRAKRLAGELKSYVDSAHCSNRRILNAFVDSRYRYMGLIEAMNAKQLQIAEQLDRRDISETQAQAEMSRLVLSVAGAEKIRDFKRR